MAISTNQLFTPTPPTIEPQSEDGRNITEWMMRQLQTISETLASISRLQLAPLAAPPTVPREGLVAPNDGTNWNPYNSPEGSKKSLNYYNGSVWEQCSLGPMSISDAGLINIGAVVTQRPFFQMVNSFSDSQSARIELFKSRTGVTDTITSDRFLDMRGGGHANGAYQEAAAITFDQSGASVGSRIPSQITLYTSDTVAGPFNHQFVFDSGGNLSVPGNLIGGSFLVITSGAAIGGVDTLTGTSGTISNAVPFHRMNPSGAYTATLTAANALSKGLLQFFQNLTAFAINSASANVLPVGSSVAGTAILPGTVGAWCILMNDPVSNLWVTVAKG